MKISPEITEKITSLVGTDRWEISFTSEINVNQEDEENTEEYEDGHPFEAVEYGPRLSPGIINLYKMMNERYCRERFVQRDSLRNKYHISDIADISGGPRFWGYDVTIHDWILIRHGQGHFKVMTNVWDWIEMFVKRNHGVTITKEEIFYVSPYEARQYFYNAIKHFHKHKNVAEIGCGILQIK